MRKGDDGIDVLIRIEEDFESDGAGIVRALAFLDFTIVRAGSEFQSSCRADSGTPLMGVATDGKAIFDPDQYTDWLPAIYREAIKQAIGYSEQYSLPRDCIRLRARFPHEDEDLPLPFYVAPSKQIDPPPTPRP
jgi:hypothetical protein